MGVTKSALGRGLLIFALFLVIVLWHSPPRAYAHFLASDNNISAELHVEPNDVPVPGQPASLDFIFADLTNKFQLAECNCRISISRQGGEVFYGPLTPVRLTQATVYSGEAAYTFPSAGIYSVILVGQPQTPNAFQSFKLSWRLNVEDIADNNHSFSSRTFAAYFLTILAICLIVGLIARVLT